MGISGVPRKELGESVEAEFEIVTNDDTKALQTKIQYKLNKANTYKSRAGQK